MANSHVGSVSEFKGKSPEELVALVKRYYKDAKDAKEPRLPEWAENISFLSGPDGQWVKWNKSTNTIEKMKRPRDRVHLVLDEITPVAEMAHAKILATRPDATALPADGSEENRQAAQVGRKFLEHCYYDLQIEEQGYDWVSWMLACGCAFTKTLYNPDGGEMVPAEERIVDINPETGQPEEMMVPILDADGNEMYKPAGGLDCITMSPYKFFPDPAAVTMDEMRYCLDVQDRTIDYAHERWPEKAKKIVPTKKVHDDVLDSAVAEMLRDGRTADADVPTVQVLECWIRPCRDFPAGKVITVVNDVLVQVEDFPLESGDLPFVMIPWGKTLPGRFWPVPPLSRLIPMQKNINKTISQICEHKNSSAFPPLFVPAGTTIEGKWTNTPGLVVKYTGEKPPTPAYPNPLPNYVIEYIDRMKSSLMDASGFLEVDRGGVPTGVNTAMGLRLLQERNDMRIGPTIRLVELAYQRMCKLYLQYAGEYFTEKHLIRTVGVDNETIVDEFRGADLRGNYDVFVLPGSTQPRSPAARQQSVIDKANAGFYGNMQDPEVQRKVRDMIDEGDFEGLFDEEKQSEKQARDEVERLISEGATPKAEFWHNAVVHIRRHMRDINFTDMEDAQRMAVWNHIQEHDMLGLQLQAEQQAKVQPPDPNFGDTYPAAEGQIVAPEYDTGGTY